MSASPASGPAPVPSSAPAPARAGTTIVRLLCAGAAKGLVLALQPAFEATTGAALEARFGAVGAMREALVGGAPCDVLVTTAEMAAALADADWLQRPTIAAIGRVATGVAVRDDGTRLPSVTDANALRAVLLGAPGVYVPDLERSTAGIHVAGVLRRLGVEAALAGRLHAYPNGAAAMRALADEGAPGAVGCTQITEIRYTPGLRVAGALPGELGLSTVYAGALTAACEHAQPAAWLLALLTGPGSQALRTAGGFDGA
jgi:molybdate transport system substrate-binding protein